VDPAVNPRYLGADWPPPWRAIRINQLLGADSAVTPDDMRRFQTDPVSPRAELFRRAFLDAARTRRGDPALDRAAALLAQWDGRYTMDNRRAVLFEAAMDQLHSRLWTELRAPDVRLPGESIIAELLQDSASAWWDDPSTPDRRETRDDVLAASLRSALALCLRDHGQPDAGGWRWDRVRHANIYHLLQLPALSALDIPVQGGPSTLSPSSGSGRFGPSWRMVVELGPDVRAWGTYPGGQSGNPASRRYTDRLTRWSTGELDPLRFPRRPEELPASHVLSTLLLTPAHP
jgi:penicillin amidase